MLGVTRCLPSWCCDGEGWMLRRAPRGSGGRQVTQAARGEGGALVITRRACQRVALSPAGELSDSLPRHRFVLHSVSRGGPPFLLHSYLRIPIFFCLLI
ncbi:hypothetical protein E2C01_018292 [Portunus trituberculatus]|uniref:Uncharacterized protein n=1 Tax=Portunus trituberculatus TaxID=210409 RepID=A0A5B7DVQ5_PORTR|nr:hypothetical protein [Portunus trituberculatus]